MMAQDCSTIQTRLTAYLDNELDPRWQSQVQQHLSACPDCQRECTALRQATQLMEAWEAPAANPRVSVEFAQKLAMRSVRQSVWSLLFGGTWQRTAWGMGMAVALLVLALNLRHGQTPSERRRMVSLPPSLSSSPGSNPTVRGVPSLSGGRRLGKTDHGITRTRHRAGSSIPAVRENAIARTHNRATVPLYASAPRESPRRSVASAARYMKTAEVSRPSLSKTGAVLLGKAKGDVSGTLAVPGPTVVSDATSTAIACLTEAPQPILASEIPTATSPVYDRLDKADDTRVVAAGAASKSPVLLVTELWTEAE